MSACSFPALGFSSALCANILGSFQLSWLKEPYEPSLEKMTAGISIGASVWVGLRAPVTGPGPESVHISQVIMGRGRLEARARVDRACALAVRPHREARVQGSWRSSLCGPVTWHRLRDAPVCGPVTGNPGLQVQASISHLQVGKLRYVEEGTLSVSHMRA